LGDQLPAQGHHHQANIADITLRTVDDFDPLSSQQPFDVGGMGSHDFEEFDLDIDWGDGNLDETRDVMSVDGSVGVGRDASHVHDDIDHQFADGFGKDADLFSHRSMSRAGSEQPLFPPMDVDLGITFGDDDTGILPGDARSPSRACKSFDQVSGNAYLMWSSFTINRGSDVSTPCQCCRY
jgi:hypothetical protein